MQKLLLATHNKGKVHELSQFLSDLPLQIVSLGDVGITDEVEEDGETYEENSQKKALAYAKMVGLPALADDGGLEIDALDGEPGVKSRRWIGYAATDEEIIEHMKKVASELPDDNRVASFKTVVSFALPTGEVWSSFAQIKGVITEKPYMKLLHGYPYRSFFYLPELQKYYHESELPPEEMKKINHRYKAVEWLKPVIRKTLSILS